MAKTALVLRATGAQGVGVTKALLKASWTVHALVRDPEDGRALALKNIGATLKQGDLSEPSSIEAAIQGCNALFLNQMPTPKDGAEAAEAAAIIDIANKAGVKHVVHSTTLPLNDPNVKEHLKGQSLAFAILGKGDVEDLVRASGLTWTIIRPGFFNTNFIAPLVGKMFPDLLQGKFINSYGPDKPLPLVDPDDIGAFVAAAFQDPERFAGKIVNVVSEFEPVPYIIDEIEKASGKKVEVHYRTDEENEEEGKKNVMVAGQKTTVGLERFVDMDEVRSWGIPLTTLGEFLKKHKDAVVP
ncbi:hypothetical protein BDV96DRAFT_551656 [Lophiotrema nucula]|uniref:NmrA-like domain-containing protein n=1 Tax=Lophiotrema nucula TaxID=690887 RepID=A0A6A5YXL8_9PLEO|nr:hypothetical protein BDV96DRAFT_551656 [Lophiotrema nucula]